MVYGMVHHWVKWNAWTYRLLNFLFLTKGGSTTTGSDFDLVAVDEDTPYSPAKPEPHDPIDTTEQRRDRHENAAHISLGPALTMEDRVQSMLIHEHGRVTFGKSGIHGWGLMARVHIPADTIVIDYR